MAHDRQVEPTREERSSRNSIKQSLELVADWLTLSVQVWREEPTVELTLLYRETLKDIPAELLRKAFLRVAKRCKFRPTPAEILEAVEIERELSSGLGNRPKWLDEPKLSRREREEALEDTKELREQLRKGIRIVAKEKSA